jgi:Response regulator receiver domain
VKSAGKILVVDDDSELRELLRLMLTSMGFEVASAANGQEACRVMEGYAPDLILLDMKMPVMDGWEFCRALEGRVLPSSCSPPPPIQPPGLPKCMPRLGSASRSNTMTWRRLCAGSHPPNMALSRFM